MAAMDLASFADYCETSSCSGGRDRIRARKEIEECLQVDGHGGAARGKKKQMGMRCGTPAVQNMAG